MTEAECMEKNGFSTIDHKTPQCVVDRGAQLKNVPPSTSTLQLVPVIQRVISKEGISLSKHVRDGKHFNDPGIVKGVAYKDVPYEVDVPSYRLESRVDQFGNTYMESVPVMIQELMTNQQGLIFPTGRYFQATHKEIRYFKQSYETFVVKDTNTPVNPDLPTGIVGKHTYFPINYAFEDVKKIVVDDLANYLNKGDDKGSAKINMGRWQIHVAWLPNSSESSNEGFTVTQWYLEW